MGRYNKLTFLDGACVVKDQSIAGSAIGSEVATNVNSPGPNAHVRHLNRQRLSLIIGIILIGAVICVPLVTYHSKLEDDGFPTHGAAYGSTRDSATKPYTRRVNDYLRKELPEIGLPMHYTWRHNKTTGLISYTGTMTYDGEFFWGVVALDANDQPISYELEPLANGTSSDKANWIIGP